MHGSLPLVRLINGVSQPSCSRIPHLTFHILRRQSLSSAHWDSNLCFPTPRHARQVRRSVSTTFQFSPLNPLKDFLGSDQQDGGLSQDTQAHGKTAVTSTPGTRTLTTMQQLLEEYHPDRILLGLVTPQIGDDFIKNADSKTFAHAVRALDPEYFIVPYRQLHRYLKPTLESEPKFRMVKSLEERAASFINILDTLVTRRQEHGHTLDLDIYRHLLQCAAAAGIGSFARKVFMAMAEDDMEPDLECYNYLMEALTWNEAYNRYERYRLRVVADHMIARAKSTRPRGFHGHGVASPNNPDSQQSIRQEILQLFNDLVNRGLNGNEATFCNLMVAMGREGDVGSVKSVLKSVWNIDVDALDKYDEEELESPTFYEEGSPLRPSARLLFTVVHVFSTNNEVSLGGMLLDYISRLYNLEIPEDVWTHLLEWTCVLALQFGARRIEQGHAEGRILAKAVESVYHVFHSEPYNVKLKIVDLVFRVKGLSADKEFRQVIDVVRECMALLEGERTRVSALYDEIRGWIAGPDYDQIFSGGIPSAEFLELRRRYVMESLFLDRDIQLILVAVRRVFKRKDWLDDIDGDGTEWPHRTIPDLVAEWRSWLPNIVPYYTSTGHVRLWGKDYRTEAMISGNSVQTAKAGILRMFLDTHSPVRLQHATDYLRRRGTGHPLLSKFQAEVSNDTQGHLSDWVLRYEMGLRQERLAAPQVTSRRMRPGPDYLSDRWKPWGSELSQVLHSGESTLQRSQQRDMDMAELDMDDEMEGETSDPVGVGSR